MKGIKINKNKNAKSNLKKFILKGWMLGEIIFIIGPINATSIADNITANFLSIPFFYFNYLKNFLLVLLL